MKLNISIPTFYGEKRKVFIAFLFFLFYIHAFSQKKMPPPSPVSIKGNAVVRQKDIVGNQLPDFSVCGYEASNKEIVSPSVVISIKPQKGADRKNIQQAINQLSSLPIHEDGFRGTIKLEPGTFVVDGSIQIQKDGIVLAGSGMGRNGTTIVGTGIDRMPLIHVKGKDGFQVDRKREIYHSLLAGSSVLNINTTGLKVGQDIRIKVEYKPDWIVKMGTGHFGGGVTAIGWKPGERDLTIARTIAAIESDQVRLDADFPVYVDTADAHIVLISGVTSEQIHHVGIENMTLRSAYNEKNPLDEDHNWDAVVLENAKDVWVRRMQFFHFAGSAVRILPLSRRITVEDCISLQPVSERGGQRRFSFYTEGQQTLIQRCFSSEGFHDFGVGFATPGPNAFVQCSAKDPISFSGTIQSWSPGVLFDNVSVEGQAIRFGNRGQDADGAGWTTGNSLIWQSTASLIQCDSAPTANNFAIACWAQFSGNAYWDQSNEHIQPRSFYYAQWQMRFGKPHPQFSWLLPKESEASSSPTREVAAALAKASNQPAWELNAWIVDLDKRFPLTYTVGKLESVTSMVEPSIHQDTFALINGWLTVNGTLSIGKRMEVPWWSGGVNPKDIASAKPHITRFVPGRTGTGYTDLLPDVLNAMRISNSVMLEHNYGLWYERRRDDHERIKRMDGEVWPPFYELPFARSGIDKAWDGLSKYDLTSYNKWYWKRLEDFATLASSEGKWLFHQHYFQHNILEAGAHYADFPWRSANNINQTGMPEPVPYAGDKRIFVDHLYYDTAHQIRKGLHQAFIKQNLKSLGMRSNVIHAISAEFTGPYPFARFWLKETLKNKPANSKTLIALSVTKDVQDSLLKDHLLSKGIDIIDIRYWHLQANGTLYAPKGGEHLAPRQHARLLKPTRPSWSSVWQSVQEYRVAYPNKAVLFSADGYDQLGWAVLMGGGSMPVLPSTTDSDFLKAVVYTHPIAHENRLEGHSSRILFLNSPSDFKEEFKKKAVEFNMIELSSGKIIYSTKDSATLTIKGPCVLWIKLQ